MKNMQFCNKTKSSRRGCEFVQLSLFGDKIVTNETQKRKRQNHIDSLTGDVYNLDIYKNVILGEEGMPVLKAYNASIPSNIVLFHERHSVSPTNSTCCFYIADWRFKQIAKDPLAYITELTGFQSAIGPDFSQFVEMSEEMRRKNCYLNKAISQIWQTNGVNVIPNVTWSTPDSYKYSSAGIPKHSVIAINSMGAKKHAVSTFLWRRGYDYMVKMLEPSLIVRYGDKMPGENESISVYFQNQHLLRMKGGAYGG